MIQPAFVNTEITEIISFKEDFQMNKQEKNGKRSASVFGRFCSAIALCTIIVMLAATALPIIALAVRSISDRPAAGAADEGSNIYSAERDGAVFRLHILANSDSTEDQRVKLAVRDAVIEYEREQTGAADAFDAADAESILRAHGDENFADGAQNAEKMRSGIRCAACRRQIRFSGKTIRGNGLSCGRVSRAAHIARRSTRQKLVVPDVPSAVHS